MDRDRMIADVAEVRQMMEDRLRLRGRTLDAQLRHARRDLPRTLRREAQYLVHVETLARNPRLLRMIDPARAARAHAALLAWLAKVDPKERARTRILNITATVALNLLLVGAGIVAFLVWRGIV